MATNAEYRSNHNIRRNVTVRLTEPQFDALTEIFTIGEEHADEYHVSTRVRTAASRAMDVLTAAWQGDDDEEAA